MVGGALKKLAIALLLVAAACRRPASVNTTPAANAPGAATAHDALVSFLAAAKAQDLQAMAMVWGTKDGPAMANMDHATLEQREVILACYLKHDSYRIVSETPATNNERVLNVELKYHAMARSANFYATPSSSGRWYLRTFDADALREICATR